MSIQTSWIDRVHRVIACVCVAVEGLRSSDGASKRVGHVESTEARRTHTETGIVISGFRVALVAGEDEVGRGAGGVPQLAEGIVPLLSADSASNVGVHADGEVVAEMVGRNSALERGDQLASEINIFFAQPSIRVFCNDILARIEARGGWRTLCPEIFLTAEHNQSIPLRKFAVEQTSAGLSLEAFSFEFVGAPLVPSLPRDPLDSKGGVLMLLLPKAVIRMRWPCA